ncbi:phage/plasmid primase, P4 family [Microbacterium sp. NPDC089987]|uniref:DNA primase family protein n=1 Tax=Microbacterium sp. NPDC089987 TaxID=3364202 RepID=UPI003822D7E1
MTVSADADTSFDTTTDLDLDLVDRGGRPDALDIEYQTHWLRESAKQHRLHMRIAYEVAADFQLKFMHVTGLGWFRYDKTHWAADDADKGATNAVMKTIRRLAADGLTDKDLYSDLVKAQTAAGAKGVLKLAAGLPGVSVSASELDADPFVLNTPSGLLDLESFELRPHDPLDRITKITRGSYDLTAPRERWSTFLEQVLPDDEVRAYLQRVLGLALVGKQLEHILVIATGSGRNGKGVTYEALGWAIGDYTHYAPSTLFERTKGNANAASPALFDLRGARFVALSETEKMARIASALLKSLTGGDPVTARGLYEKPITFLASWLILLVTNHLPTLPADDPAVWERVRVIMFDVFIQKKDRDPRLASKLQDEADGILTWAVEGLRQYWAGGLAEPEAVTVATSGYAAAQDSVKRFIEAVCTESPSTGGNTTKELHDAYTDWATAERIFAEHRLGRTEFGHALDRLGFPSVKKSRGMVRAGLGLAGNGGVPISSDPYDRSHEVSAPDADPPTASWESSDDPPSAVFVG